MNRLVALGLALALAGPATALPTAREVVQTAAVAVPDDDAKCDSCDALDLLQDGDYKRGRHILEMRAAKGEAFAVTGLGMMYQNGWGVPVDYGRAMGFYQTAVGKGDLAAMNQIGYMLLNGLGRKADRTSAWCWFARAAEGGYERSAHHLADLMAGGMQPVACKSSQASAPDAAGAQQQGAEAAAALELWSGVREGMTPDQAASKLTAPFSFASPTAGPIDNRPVSDAVLAPAALFGHAAIVQVLFVDHRAKLLNVVIDPPSDDTDKNLALARELVDRFDAAYGHSLDVFDEGGVLSGVWRRGDLTIDLEYMPLPDQPPTFMVIFKRNGAPDRHIAPFGFGVPS